MARITLENVGLTFRIRQNRQLTLKEFLVDHVLRGRRRPVLTIRALHDITLTLDRGDRLAILGSNGAGKSTLLRLLAGIYPPSTGGRRVEGRIRSLFDLHTGFELEASGWDNIAYRSYLLGATPAMVKARRQAIADFADLGELLNAPVRYYSAGMLVRLAFAIDTAFEPEILLVDEVLGAGDLAFQQKARQRIRDLITQAHILVAVGHDLATLQALCDRALWLDHGGIRLLGPCADVIAAYTRQVHGHARPAGP